ncbi:MAG: hypothetical protein EOP81_15400 [Variovorax sp.]|nr:MAG: hypothetical protein EOP81_15400 [Variovorax sp.]
MTTLDRPFRTHFSRRAGTALGTLFDEACVLAEALLSPRSVIDEVEEMRALRRHADRIEATQPARAAVLRWRASRVGLR